VPQVATFDHGNDLDGHETVEHLYQEKSWGCEIGQPLKYKQHYRMALATVGRDLRLGLFNSTREYLRLSRMPWKVWNSVPSR